MGDEAATAPPRHEDAAHGVEPPGVPADLSDDAQVARAVAERADLSVHPPAFEVSDEDFDAVMDLDVRAPWRATLAAGALVHEAGSGSIVDVGSISGMIVNRPQMQPAHDASKAAVHQLTTSRPRSGRR